MSRWNKNAKRQSWFVVYNIGLGILLWFKFYLVVGKPFFCIPLMLTVFLLTESLVSVSYKEWNLWLLELVWWSNLVLDPQTYLLMLHQQYQIRPKFGVMLFLHVSRYPLGRVIGGTVYPGLTLTAGSMWWYVLDMDIWSLYVSKS